MSSTVPPVPSAAALSSSTMSFFSTIARSPPSFGHFPRSVASARVRSPSQSPFAQRIRARTLRRPSDTRRISTAPSPRACRTCGSPYAATPPSSFRISSMSLWTIDFSRMRSSFARTSLAFSTSSLRPYSSVYPVSRNVGRSFFRSSWWM